MNVSCPSDGVLCRPTVLRTLAVMICAIISQSTATPSPSLGSSDTSRSYLRGKEQPAVRVVSGRIDRTGMPGQGRGQSRWIDWPRSTQQVERPSAAVAHSKLLGISLVDTVSDLLALLPLWKTVGEGEPLTLSIGVDAISLVSLQWYFNGQPIPGANRGILTLESVTSEQVGRYELRATLPEITLASVPTDVQINETDGTVDRSVAAFDRLGDSANLIRNKAAKRTTAKSGATARGFSGTQIFSTIGATKEDGEPNHCGIAGGASEWFAWQLPTNGTAVITTDGSNFDTVLAVYVGPGDSYATLTSTACDNDSGANGKTSRVSFTGTAGTIYYIAVDGVNAAKGTVKLNYTVGTPPAITSQPASRTTALGKTATLTVGAMAFPVARYQWTFNDMAIPNATNASLTLTDITQTNLGAYRVCVTNAIGSVWSVRANLLPEAPLHFSSRRFAEDGFHLAVYGPAGTNYVIDCSTNMNDWLPIHTNRAQTGIFNFIDSTERTNGHAFYRVRSAP